MPRKPIGDVAMTGAERLRRWRERKRAERPDASLSDRQKLSQAQAEIARLRLQLAEATAAPTVDATRRLRGELMNAQFEIDRLRRQLAEAHKSEPEQIAVLRQHISVLEQERARRDRAAKAAQTKAVKAAAPPVEGEKDDPRIARLEKANSNLRKKINRMQASFDASLQSKGQMTFAASSLIAKALHPDSAPSHKDREEAFKAFSAWKADSKDAARRR